MKVATTIQITPEEDREISRLKEEMELPSKKSVILKGLEALRQILKGQDRRRRLQSASRTVREDSLNLNEEWAPLSTALKTR